MDSGKIMVMLDYDPNDNTITHEDGRVLNDISHLISHEELMFLKQVGGTKYIESDEDGVVYVLTAPIPDEEDNVLTFYYDKEKNVILDNEGFIMFNIFSFISPQDLMLLKTKKEDIRVYGVHGRIVELIYSVE